MMIGHCHLTSSFFGQVILVFVCVMGCVAAVVCSSFLLSLLCWWELLVRLSDVSRMMIDILNGLSALQVEVSVLVSRWVTVLAQY